MAHSRLANKRQQRSSPPHDKAMSDASPSRYTIRTRLGQGGMGEVYLADDVLLRRSVALKFLSVTADSRSEHDRLLREARAAAAIDHPFVCKVYEVGEQDRRPYIAMEFVDGQTLGQRLASGPFTRSMALGVAIEIAEALIAAHARGIVHRDLKPANIMLTVDGHVKVMDFGIARRLDGHPEQETVDRSIAGTITGTVAYMAPEQLRGDPIDARADIFAAGLILYQLVSGHHPFEKRTSLDTAAAILHEPTPPLPGAVGDATLESIVQRMLAKDRLARYSTIEKVRDELRSLLDARQESSTVTAAVFPARRPVRAMAIAAVTAIVVVIGLTTFLLRGTVAVRPAPTDAVTSLVALPARVTGGEQDAFLADAVANTISNQLGGLANLDLKRPPTAADVERVQGDTDRLAALYGVSALVTSSVVTAGDALTLDVQLTNMATRSLIWSGTFKGRRTAYVDLVRQASDGLRHAIRPTATQTPAGRATPTNSDVELLLQRGYFFYNQFKLRGRQTDFELAHASFSDAAAIDTGRADPTTGLAQLYVATERTGAQAADIVRQAEPLAHKALEMDSRNSMAWGVLSDLERLRAEPSRTRQLDYALKAVLYDPHNSYAHNLLSAALSTNSYVLAIAAAAEAERIDPLQLDGPIYQAVGYSAIGQLPDALRCVERALRVEPDNLFGIYIKALILMSASRIDEGEVVVRQLAPMAKAGRFNPRWQSFNEEWVAVNRALQRGDGAEADRLLSHMIKLVLTCVS